MIILIQAKVSYFGFENMIEWICYITAIIVVFDFDSCCYSTGLRYSWQWQVIYTFPYTNTIIGTDFYHNQILLQSLNVFQIGAISVTMSWLNLLSTLRKFPFLGIYVVMFTDVLQTFLKFSLIILLFIVAFSLGFHALIGEQV